MKSHVLQTDSYVHKYVRISRASFLLSLISRVRFAMYSSLDFKRKNCDHFAVFIKNTEEINNVWYIILVCGGNILFTYVQHVLII